MATPDPTRSGTSLARSCGWRCTIEILPDFRYRRSAQLTGRMPIVAHETITGVDCCGCIVAVVDGSNVELRCNECAAVVGVVVFEVLRGLLGLDQAGGERRRSR